MENKNYFVPQSRLFSKFFLQNDQMTQLEGAVVGQ